MNCDPFAEFKAARFRICRRCRVERHASFFTWYRNGEYPAKICSACWQDAVLKGLEKRQFRRSVFEPYREQIEALAAMGYRSREIMERIVSNGRTLAALQTFCVNRGISTKRQRQVGMPPLIRPTIKKVSDDTLDQVRQMINKSGISYSEVARVFGVTRSTVAGWVYGYGLRGMKSRPEYFIRRETKIVSRDAPATARPGSVLSTPSNPRQ
jgi:hypothetical protein